MLPLVDDVAGEGHDDFAWQRNARGLNRHQDGDAGVSDGRDHKASNEGQKEVDDFFCHGFGNLGEYICRLIPVCGASILEGWLKPQLHAETQTNCRSNRHALLLLAPT